MKNPLKTICIIGLVLALILSWGLLLFALLVGRDLPREGRFAAAGFEQELRAYDHIDAPKLVLEGEDPAQIERHLSRLQGQVRGVEEQLSVLKRRRTLAQIDRRYIDAYERAAREAAEAFPYSAPIAVVAVDAVLMGAAFPLSPAAVSLLKDYSSRITQDRFDLLELGLHVLAGDLDNPAIAATLPAHLLSQDLSALPERLRRDLLTNEFLLRTYRGDIQGAGNRLNYLLADAAEDAFIRRMGAEFFYDHQNPHRAAELFLGFEGEIEIARAADALVLAGELSAARNIWLVLSTPKSFYNLAASSSSATEEMSWLERLVAQRGSHEDALWSYSIIRYTRLLDNERSTAVLDDESMRQHPLFDLELLRRQQETMPQTRATAEVWMLLGRHPTDEALYEWAAWYFDHQRLFGDTERLLRNAERAEMTGAWIDMHRSLALLRDGRIADGERILLNAYNRDASPRGSSPDWRIPANLGRIQESGRSIDRALEYYEAAAALLAGQRNMPGSIERTAAAQIQMRISRCLETLGRIQESQRAIERALELDPNDINIRREFARF